MTWTSWAGQALDEMAHMDHASSECSMAGYHGRVCEVEWVCEGECQVSQAVMDY